MTLDGGLSAECADVCCVLRDFHLLHLLTEGSTISGREEQLAFRSLLFNISKESVYRPDFVLQYKVHSDYLSRAVVDAENIFVLQLSNTSLRDSSLNGMNAYLVPYLPVTPTFLVLFVILAVLCC